MKHGPKHVNAMPDRPSIGQAVFNVSLAPHLSPQRRLYPSGRADTPAAG